MRTILAMGAVSLGLSMLAAAARADEEKIPLNQVPKAVMDAAKARFPGAEIKEAAEEVEDGQTTYEVALKHDGRNIDVALKPDGTIMEIEKEVAVKDLPAAVTSALKAKYPGATIKKAEEITADNKVGYEVVVEQAGKKAFEVKLDSKGKIQEIEEEDGQ